MADDRLGRAARNNAEWCDAVCRSHGVAGRFGGAVWSAPGPTPPLYPEVVTLAPDVSAGSLVDRAPRGAGVSIKDSFASLDLSSFGFRVLFDASWIARAPGGATDVDERRWSALTSAAELADWVEAWRGDGEPVDVFRTPLLDDPTVTIVADRDGRGRIVGGAAWCLAAGVLGVSNVFGSWPGVVRSAADRHPGATLVGYESGADLDAAVAAGFVPIGPLRVWIRD